MLQGGRVTCREEILQVVAELTRRRPDRIFTTHEVVKVMQERGTAYSTNTIRQHICSRMCRNATRDPHYTYADVERVAIGTYRLLDPGAAARVQRRRARHAEEDRAR